MGKTKKSGAGKNKEKKKKGIITWRHLLPLLLTLFIASSVYINSLQGEFIWDDKDLIVSNQYIKDWKHLSIAFTQDFFYSSHKEGKIGYYRPVITLSYMLDYQLWGLNPFGYHLTNLVFHTLTCLLIYLMIFSLTSNLPIAFISTLLFAIHPIHTESIAWISGRTDVIGSFFFFFSFLLYMYGEKVGKLRYYALSLALFVLALLSKEMVITLPLLIVVYDYYCVAERDRREAWKRAKYWAGYWILIVVYVVVRFLILKVVTGNPHIEELNRGKLLLTFSKGFLYYLSKLLLPFNLNAYVMLDLASFSHIGVWTGIVVIVGLVVTGLRLRDNRLSFGAGFFLISLLPLTNLIAISAPVDIDFPLAERFLYLPSFGFCLVLGVVIGECLRLNKLMAGIVISLLCIFYSCSTFARNQDWRKEEAFYELTAVSSPRSPVIHNNLGVVYKSNGKYNEAIEQFKRSLELNPRLIEANNNLGSAYKDKGWYQEAMAEYQRALKLFPDYTEAHNNLGNLYEKLGRYDLAEQELKIAIQLKPDLAEAHSNLGIVYFDLKRKDEAMKEFQEALRIKPNFAEPYYNLGNLYEDLSQYEKAIWYYHQAIKSNPRYARAHFKLGVVYTKMTLYREAEKAYEQALLCKPDYAPPHLNLGVIYLSYLVDRKRAIYHFKKTLEIDPNQPQAEAIRRKLKELEG
jgi:tetratricopeptide (TPR) repeat protein